MEFSRRARTYSRLDERFARHTRFFAAAALTNTVLAELSTHRARWICISTTTLGALVALGGLLEALNLSRAERLETEAVSNGLDAAFVEMEQSYVESVLRDWSRSCAPRHHQLITELDRLLRIVITGRVPFPASCNVRRYTRVLRAVTGASGHYPSFASCADRMRIGTALIHEASQLGPSLTPQPSTTSISLLGRAASSSQSSSSSSM